jgi:hypothetical protein
MKILYLIALTLLVSCSKDTPAPATNNGTHNIMIVNYTRYNLDLISRADPSLNRSFYGADTVYYQTDKLDLFVEKGLNNPIHFSWFGVFIILYDNGDLKQVYEKQGTNFYIRYDAN